MRRVVSDGERPTKDVLRFERDDGERSEPSAWFESVRPHRIFFAS